MPKKTRRKKRVLEVDSEAIKVLRTLNQEENFSFYLAIAKPTGEEAGSLPEFYEKIKSVKLDSLVFHLQRKDFQNWTKRTLGDSKLARRIGRIPPSHDEKLRRKMCTIIEKRIKELRAASSTLTAVESLAVPPEISTSQYSFVPFPQR